MVKCHRERSQYLNRMTARHILVQKIQERHRRIKENLAAEKAKERKRQAKRPANVKARMREGKKHQAEKKNARRKVMMQRLDTL